LNPDTPITFDLLEQHFFNTINEVAADSALWIVGSSGGADSTCLLHLCAAYRDQINPNQQIIAAHMNHHLRGIESDGDEAFCGDLCRELDIPLETESCHVRKQAVTWGVGIEEAGRRARHAFFARLCRSFAPALVLLAHHADDQAETMLFRFLRGAEARGLCGIRPRVMLYKDTEQELCLIRPLLSVPKEALVSYLQDRNVFWREDASNEEDDVDRNRIRLKLLPELDAFRPGLRTRLCRMAERIQQADACVERLATQYEEERLEDAVGGVLLKVDENGQLPLADIILMRLLNRIISRHFPEIALTSGQREAFVRLYRNPCLGALLDLGEGCLARRERDGVFVSRNFHLPADAEVVFPEHFPFRANVTGLEIHAARVLYDEAWMEADREDDNVQWINPQAVCGALRWRPRRPGDRFRPLGAPGTRKVKEILIDEKITQRDKRNIRLLCDDEGILWLWPLRLAERAKLPDGYARAEEKEALRVEVIVRE